MLKLQEKTLTMQTQHYDNDIETNDHPVQKQKLLFSHANSNLQKKVLKSLLRKYNA